MLFRSSCFDAPCSLAHAVNLFSIVRDRPEVEFDLTGANPLDGYVKRGENFARAFPRTQGSRISGQTPASICQALRARERESQATEATRLTLYFTRYVIQC